jgi:methionine-rich copper-binding protein CopC
VRRVAAVAGVLLATALLAVVPVSSASAHDYLVSSSPTAGATVTAAPSEVSLTFNDLVLDLAGDGSSSIVEVTGPDAGTTHFETGCASILSHTVSAPVALGGAGSYTVSWQIVSSDGHPVSNSLTFTYAPAAGTPASAGTASAPACGRPGATALGAAPSTTTSADDGLAGWLILAVAGGIVLLAVVAVVVVLLVSGRRRESAESSPSAQSESEGAPKN